MKSAICTLFEGSYHYGVGALVNSLCKSGFSGTVFAGYRGDLPEWVAQLPSISNAAGQNLRKVTESVSIAFLPYPGTRHMANLKPDFMLQVLDELSPDADQIFYIDPDVVCVGPWGFFEQWAQEGAAIVIDGNFPMPQKHPVRRAWHRYFEAHGMKFGGCATDYYFNSGFLGVSRADKNFLHAWKKIHDLIEPEGVLVLPIGLSGAPEKQHRSYPFWLPDQDALNVAADLEGMNISPMGCEGMGWKQPFHFLLHACGSPKPWVNTVLRESIRGKTPDALMYFRFLEFFAGPVIQVMSPKEIRRRKTHLRIAGAVAPFFGSLQWLKRNQ